MARFRYIQRWLSKTKKVDEIVAIKVPVRTAVEKVQSYLSINDSGTVIESSIHPEIKPGCVISVLRIAKHPLLKDDFLLSRTYWVANEIYYHQSKRGGHFRRKKTQIFKTNLADRIILAKSVLRNFRRGIRNPEMMGSTLFYIEISLLHDPDIDIDELRADTRIYIERRFRDFIRWTRRQKDKERIEDEV